MRTRVAFGLVALVIGAGCTANTFTGSGDGGKPPPVGGGGDDAGTDAVVPPGCDATKLPTDDACVINEAEAIFVSASTGSANGNGTMAKPISSLDAGIAMAKKDGKRVYACAETYAEQIKLESGVSVFGYFDCSNGWVVTTTHAKVAPAASPVAHATDVTDPTRIEAVDLIAPDFTSGSQSSIALMATNAAGLHFIHGKFHAGTGGKGDDGQDGIQLTDSGNAKNGGNAWPEGVCTGMICPVSVYNGIAGGMNACTGETGHNPVAGGTGGYGGKFSYSSQFGWVGGNPARSDGSPTVATAQVAQGGVYNIGGAPGAAGADGQDGQSGLAQVGVVAAAGYSPIDGAGGKSGQPGQSGGGSAGHQINFSDYNHTTNSAITDGTPGWGEPGPSGGAGGCPALAAGAGKGGGASIAIVAIQSGMSLEDIVVESSNGGAGGKGGFASEPMMGGAGGKGVSLTYSGGNGGSGGAAGFSGSGAGGPSIGVAYNGAAVQMLASKIAQGQGGAGVAQLDKPGVKSVPASAAGASKDVYAF